MTVLSAPRRSIPIFGAFAVLVGVLQLGLAGAPGRFLAVQVAALVAGAAVLWAIRPIERRPASWAGPISALGAAVVLATALLGVDVDGVRRWWAVGPLTIQPGLVVVPLLLVLYAQRRSLVATASLFAVAIALALQPDRAMAAALAAGLSVILAADRQPRVVLAFVVSGIGLAAAFLRPDDLPPIRFVEGVYAAALDAGIGPAALVAAGTLLMLAPGLAGFRRGNGVDRDQRLGLRVFAATWLTIVIAAAVGHYPNPLLGYGSSAVLGYLLCAPAFSNPHGPVGKRPG